MLANVSRFLDEKAESQPEVDALLVPRGRTSDGSIDYLRLSFRELAAEQNEWARRLREEGIREGSRVLLMVKPGLPLIAICFALFKVGAVPIVIDPGMGLKSFLNCVRRSKPEFLVGISLAIWVSRVFRKSFRSVSGKLKVGGPLDRVASAFSLEDAAATRSDDLAAVLFTSGSTGAPKGVCYEHGMFEAQVAAIRDQYQIEPGEIDLPMLPIFALFNPALGMTTVVPEINPSKPATVQPEKIVQAIQQCKVTNSFGSPALWAKIGVYCDSHDVTLPTLKRILMAGAPVPPPLMHRYRRILPSGQVHSPYGATEVLPVSSVSDDEILSMAAARTAKGAGTCVGRILPDVKAKILPVKDGAMSTEDLDAELGPGEIGEIVVTGPSVTKEYDQLPEATRLSKVNDGKCTWHRIGDLGYIDEEGRLWFCGRKVERVVTKNSIFYTDRCEGVVNVHPSVFRSALIGYEKEGEVVPALMIEPFPDKYPKNGDEKKQLFSEVRSLAKACPVTNEIDLFLLHKGFPVDVRHNAKIHRLHLAKEINRGR